MKTFDLFWKCFIFQNQNSVISKIMNLHCILTFLSNSHIQCKDLEQFLKCIQQFTFQAWIMVEKTEMPEIWQGINSPFPFRRLTFCLAAF